jgi:hypothetical protein
MVVVLGGLFEVSHGRFYGALLIILSQHSLGATGDKGERNQHSNCQHSLHTVPLSSRQGFRPKVWVVAMLGGHLVFGLGHRWHSAELLHHAEGS